MRIGVLGAARIAPIALMRPSAAVEGVAVTAVAARDPQRARRFAARFGVPRVHASYRDLIDDDELDAVYIPLPNGLHARWTMAAVAAGRHVLCEKPFTANASEARQVAQAAAGTGRVVMEALHYRYHPLARRMEQVVRSGQPRRETFDRTPTYVYQLRAFAAACQGDAAANLTPPQDSVDTMTLIDDIYTAANLPLRG